MIGILKRDPQNKNPTIMLRFGHGYHYKGSLAEAVRCLDLEEDAALPPDKAVGTVSYSDLRKK